jgi:hypothetical protein
MAVKRKGYYFMKVVWTQKRQWVKGLDVIVTFSCP